MWLVHWQERERLERELELVRADLGACLDCWDVAVSRTQVSETKTTADGQTGALFHLLNAAQPVNPLPDSPDLL